MQLRIVAVGKLRDGSIAALATEFEKRLGAYHRLEIVEVPASRGTDPGRAMREEAERILRRIKEDPLWLLDRSGVELSSEALSRKITQFEREGHAKLSLAICGTFGAAPELRKRARFVWSLSKLTFLHEWARLLVLEQLYRAAKIARGEPYHH